MTPDYEKWAVCAKCGGNLYNDGETWQCLECGNKFDSQE